MIYLLLGVAFSVVVRVVVTVVVVVAAVALPSLSPPPKPPAKAYKSPGPPKLAIKHYMLGSYILCPCSDEKND